MACIQMDCSASVIQDTEILKLVEKKNGHVSDNGNFTYIAETKGLYLVFAISGATSSKTGDNCTTTGRIVAETPKYTGSDPNTFAYSFVVDMNIGDSITRTANTPSSYNLFHYTVIYKLNNITSISYVSNAYNIENVDSIANITDDTKKYIVIGAYEYLNGQNGFITADNECDVKYNIYKGSNLYIYSFNSIIENKLIKITARASGSWGRSALALYEFE